MTRTPNIFRTAIAAFLIMTALVYSADWKPVEIPNPSFEEGDRLPKGWQSHQDGKAELTFVWDSEYARTGSRSVYIKNEGPQHGAWITGPVTFEPGATYRANVWYRSRITRKDHSAFIAILAFGMESYMVNGKQTRWAADRKVAFPTTGDEWKLLTFEFTPSPETKSGTLWLWSMLGAGGEVWFDDYSLEIKRTP